MYENSTYCSEGSPKGSDAIFLYYIKIIIFEKVMQNKAVYNFLSGFNCQSRSYEVS
ncbi:MAG: hypothetical protein PWP38_1231 [Clostridiales bacterium]|jgi:hypothetical protein|nr:hypothetical protein [Clostridiales bacterium]